MGPLAGCVPYEMVQLGLVGVVVGCIPCGLVLVGLGVVVGGIPCGLVLVDGYRSLGVGNTRMAVSGLKRGE